MPGVWEVLGYDETAHEIVAEIAESSDLIVLQGPPGTGKTWLAKAIGALWEGEGGSTIVAQGDGLRSDLPLYALGFAMAGLSSGWRSLGGNLSEVARAGESLAGTAGLLSSTVRALAQLRPRNTRARSMYLAEAEQQVLFDLERLASQKPLLLIADNLHWWDEPSLEFLGRLREARMRDAFPFLAQMRLLAVQTTEPYQAVSWPRAHSALLDPRVVRWHDLQRLSRDALPEVLVALGAPEDLATQHATTIYSLTGGHLALVRRCARRLELGDSDVFTEARDTGEFVGRLLTERIRSLGGLGSAATELLQIAASLGLRFRRDEVTCALGGDWVETARVLRSLREQDLVELSEDAGWFVHDLYRQHFLADGTFDRAAIHDRLADCLRTLSPSDYELRCQNALRAERVRDAGSLAVQAGLANLREGRAWTAISAESRFAMSSAGLDPVMASLATSLDHYKHDRFADCLLAVATIPHGLPEVLLAEADLVRASCLMTTRSDQDRADGRAILEAWSGFESSEPDVGTRILQLLLFGLTMVPDKEPGRRVEARIKSVLRTRVGFDETAVDAMYVLDRCSSSLYEPDVSVIRTREAAAHFGPDGEQTVIRRPVEYFLSLVNLAADLVVNARYADAREVSATLEQLVAGFDSGVFPRLDYPRTTALLADYRLGIVEAGAAADLQRHINSSHATYDDPFYSENALAAYLALDGQFAEALEMYDHLAGRLATIRNPEPSMSYLVRANRASTRFVAGDRAGLAEEWSELDVVVRRVPYPIARFLVRRHELLGEVIARGAIMTPTEFDVCLTAGRHELGPPWDQLGRGFRMPEVQWWH